MALNTAWSAASEDMYKAQQQQQQNGNADASQNAGDQSKQNGNAENVTDVDFEEVK
jgi:molecular chaperone DnaK